MYWLELLRQWLPHPPASPPPPDVTRLPAPRQLRFIPHGQSAWADAMQNLQVEVNNFCHQLSDGIYWQGCKDWAPITGIAGVILGLVVGVYFGLRLPAWLKARKP